MRARSVSNVGMGGDAGIAQISMQATPHLWRNRAACAPVGRRTIMNALELLKQQHEEVKSLFERYDQAEDEDEKQILFEDIADNLAAHSSIEEQLFYPAAYQGDAQPLLREAGEEHLSIKRLLADLLVMSPEDENFDAKLKVVQEQDEHHV